MEHFNIDSPLLLPEILQQILIHLKGKDLFNAILVNKTWAAIGSEINWRKPSPTALVTLPQDTVRQRAHLVRVLWLDGAEVETTTEYLRRFEFVRLEEHIFHRTRKPFNSTVDLQPFLSTRLKNLELLVAAQPVPLFEILSQNRLNLRRLRVGIAFARQVRLGRVQEDLRHLPHVIRQNVNLVDFELLLGMVPDDGCRLSDDCLSTLFSSRVNNIALTCFLPKGFSRNVLRSVPCPLDHIRRLRLDRVAAIDVVNLLRHMNLIQDLHVEIVPGSLAGFFSAIGMCTSLEKLRLIIDWSLGINPILKPTEIINPLVSLTRLNSLCLNLPETIFTTAQLIKIGAAMPALRSINAPFFLEITELMYMTPLLIFPNLEVLLIKAIRIPASGCLRINICAPSGAIERRQWLQCLETEAQVAIFFLLERMSRLKYLRPRNHFANSQYIDGDIDNSDVVGAWKVAFGEAMQRFKATSRQT